MIGVGAHEVVGILLAAGGGRRFTGPTHKLEALLDGRPVWAHALGAAAAAGFAHLIVVTGAVDLEPPPTIGDTTIHRTYNARWADGQITSLLAGLATARELGADVAVVGLADQPFVEPDAWRRVAASGSPIAVATYDGVRGNPVRLGSTVWDLLPPSGDEGARAVMRLRPELVEEVPCQGSAADIDTLEDLDRWT